MSTNNCSSCGDTANGSQNDSQGVYATNMWNINGNLPGGSITCDHQQACNECIDIIKGVCMMYTGANLTSLGISQYDDLDTILIKLNAVKVVQDTKNANILIALNDINTRLNIITGNAHSVYNLL